MREKILLRKSKENYETGEWAEDRVYLDVSISRYYYSAYQKIIHISKVKGFYKKPQKGENAHIVTIDRFGRGIGDKLSTEEKIQVLMMKKLRGLRNRADYSETRFDNKNDYNLEFKFHFNNINEILDELI